MTSTNEELCVGCGQIWQTVIPFKGRTYICPGCTRFPFRLDTLDPGLVSLETEEESRLPIFTGEDPRLW